MIVNLQDYAISRIQVLSSHRGDKVWDIEFATLDGNMLGEATYVNQYGEGLQDCDIPFSELDCRLISEAIGTDILECAKKTLQEMWDNN